MNLLNITMSLLYHTFENSTVDKSSRIECRIYMNWNKLFVNQLYLPKTVWVGIISFNIFFQMLLVHGPFWKVLPSWQMNLLEQNMTQLPFKNQNSVNEINICVRKLLGHGRRLSPRKRGWSLPWVYFQWVRNNFRRIWRLW